jgi:predicted RNase H-like HicB family nuclease
MSTRTFTAAIHREGDGYVALCPEVDVASQGDTVEQARDTRREAPFLIHFAAFARRIQ